MLLQYRIVPFTDSKLQVVIGRNQNPWKECHIKKMDDMDVMLARRPTGGGAVYQVAWGSDSVVLFLSFYPQNFNVRIGSWAEIVSLT